MTLPLLLKDEKDAEKVQECSIDHWFDGAGYGLNAYHFKQTKALPEEKPKIAAIKEELAKRGLQNRRRLT